LLTNKPFKNPIMKNLFFVSLMLLGTTLGVVSCGEDKPTQETKSEDSTTNVETQSVEQDSVVLENQK